jgi:signal transduction histidine kinase
MNVMKHAEATSANLTVDVQPDTFVLRISDDGMGISPNRLHHIMSHGLASMKHRIAALGGVWDIEAPPGGGTMVTARIPMASMLLNEPPEAVPAA